MIRGPFHKISPLKNGLCYKAQKYVFGKSDIPFLLNIGAGISLNWTRLGEFLLISDLKVRCSKEREGKEERETRP